MIYVAGRGERSYAHMQSERERERERGRERERETDLAWVLLGLIGSVEVGENGDVDAVQRHRPTER